MVRWYDWLLALFVADLLVGTFLYVLSEEVWYMQTIGSIAFIALWDVWKQYCEFRKQLESKR